LLDAVVGRSTCRGPQLWRDRFLGIFLKLSAFGSFKSYGFSFVLKGGVRRLRRSSAKGNCRSSSGPLHRRRFAFALEGRRRNAGRFRRSAEGGDLPWGTRRSLPPGGGLTALGDSSVRGGIFSSRRAVLLGRLPEWSGRQSMGDDLFEASFFGGPSLDPGPRSSTRRRAKIGPGPEAREPPPGGIDGVPSM